MRHYLGIDIGSVSVKAVVLDENLRVVDEKYVRSRGEPGRTAEELIGGCAARYRIASQHTTGSGGKLVAGQFVNEVVALSLAAARLLPQVKTIIEMGGEDAKCLRLSGGKLADFAINNVCAAGTGSFLDQQAARLGCTIEEFSALALKSKHPPRIAGRCTVFAKSDMIHLQQKGTPDYEIIAGLCLAVARNFVGSAGRRGKWQKPIAFLGGVAGNDGMLRAFETVLDLKTGELLRPGHFASLGAIGAVLHARQ